MSGERRTIKSMWSAQETDRFTMSLDDIRAQSSKFQRNIRNRNLREYAATAFVVLVFGLYAWILPGLLLKAGSILVILGSIVMAWLLHQRGPSEVPPLGDSVVAHVAFHRRELVRQRDALRSVALWYLAPFVPGTVVFCIGLYLLVRSVRTAMALPMFYAALALLVAVFAAVWLLNRWGAARLQKQIDALSPPQ